MLRQIIHIDEEKCNGCGLCATACHEGAIDIVDGKARLVREDFCDGLGDCLPNCPTGAITFETREAPEFDRVAADAARCAREAIVEADSMARPAQEAAQRTTECGCPGSGIMQFDRQGGSQRDAVRDMSYAKPASRLKQWPCQIRLVPTRAPFYEGAKLLIAADCTAYAHAGMHEDFMKDRITLIGCPKLDDVDYTDKLTEIIANNDIRSVTIVRMEVPCCGGLQRAAENALRGSGKFIPWQVVTVARDGRILE